MVVVVVAPNVCRVCGWSFLVMLCNAMLSALSSFTTILQGAQWLSGRVLDSRLRGRGFEHHRRHCIVVLEQDTFILA